MSQRCIDLAIERILSTYGVMGFWFMECPNDTYLRQVYRMREAQ